MKLNERVGKFKDRTKLNEANGRLKLIDEKT